MPNIKELESYVKSNVALRVITKLESAGGPNSKIFPSTYAGGTYATEYRLINGEKTRCVLIDSIASQANRMEEALQSAYDANKITFPMAIIKFDNNGLDGTPSRITSLQAPHRIADALFRESLLNKKAFRNTNEGKKIFEATPANAIQLFKYCPTALLFGMWDSTGVKGGLGNKFQRAIASEIVGINACFGVGTASRIDPVITRTQDTPVYETEDGGWTLDETKAKKEKDKPKKYKKKGKLSEVNLGSVTPGIKTYEKDDRSIINPITDNPIHKGDSMAYGATISHAEQTCVLSLAALRKLYFVPNNQVSADSMNTAARTVLAALGLVAFTLSISNGLDLRSGCTLVSQKPITWEVLGDGKNDFALDAKSALDLFNDAVKNAENENLSWNTNELILTPGDRLIEAIKKSNSVQEDNEKED